MVSLRRAWEWMGYGALAPLLMLSGLLGIYQPVQGLYFGVAHEEALGSIAIASGAIAVIIGIVFVLRPHVTVWLAVAGASTVAAANGVWVIAINAHHVQAQVEDVVPWMVIGVLLPIYAFHCHRC